MTKKGKKIEKITKLIADGEIDKALEIADANDVEFLFEMGALLGQKGHHKIAEKIFHIITQINPNLADAWFNKGLALGKQGKYDEEIKCYDKALKINPNYSEAWSNKGVAFGKLGKYDEEIKCYDKALKINSKDNKAWFNKGVTLGKLGKYDEAIKCYDQAIIINPNNDSAWYNKGITLGKVGKHDEALKCFEESIKINPKFPEAWTNKGTALRNIGKYNEAIKCHEEAIKINPNIAEAWSNKGVALGEITKLDEAIKCYDKALKINSKDDKAWFNKGVALGDLKKYNEAIKCFERAIKLNPNFAEAWYNKGLAHGKLEKFNEEIKCYNKALKINPNLPKAWLNKGAALSNLGKPDKAIKCYNEALKINPSFFEAWVNKGLELGNLGKHDEEIKCYDKALKINPKDDKALLNKGVALGEVGKQDEEIKCYEEAIKINPNCGEAYGNLGITLLNKHEYNKAAIELGKAKELFSNRGLKKDAEKAHKYEIWAINALELISRLKPLDEQFISSLNSRCLTELKEKSLEISKGIKGVIKEFEEKEIPKDVNELLISKATCFTALSYALKFEKVDLEELGDTKKIFEKWGFDTFITAVNSLDTFIRRLNKYTSLKEITKDREKRLLQALRLLYVLDGELTEEITDKIKGEPFPAKPTLLEKKPAVKYINIADTKKDWVRVCLVQLDFSLTRKFPYTLTEEVKEKIRDKVFEALEIAQKEKVDIICLPELSFDKEWTTKIKDRFKEGIIICGSFYDNNNCNCCQIIIDGKDYPYKKCHASIMEEKDGEGMEPGNRLFVFQTKSGKISVLTCVDFDYELTNIISNYDLDFIINHRFDIDREHTFQEKANIIIDRPDGSRYPAFILQVNPKKTEWGKYKGGGGTIIIGWEHTHRITKYIADGLRPNDEIKYKIYEAKDEMMLIAELKIGALTDRRTRVCNWYRYDGKHWALLEDKGIWL